MFGTIDDKRNLTQRYSPGFLLKIALEEIPEDKFSEKLRGFVRTIELVGQSRLHVAVFHNGHRLYLFLDTFQAFSD